MYLTQTELYFCDQWVIHESGHPSHLVDELFEISPLGASSYKLIITLFFSPQLGDVLRINL